MTPEVEELRSSLADLAEWVRPVDLYAPSLERSYRIARRRTFAAAGATALAVLVVVAIVLAGGPRLGAAPVGPAQSAPSGVDASSSVGPTEGNPAQAAPTNGPGTALGNTVLELPAWPAGSGACASGQVRFLGGTHIAAGQTTLTLVKAVDINLPGGAATVGLIKCAAPDAIGPTQVLGYLGSTGTPRLLRQVVGALPGPGHVWADDIDTATGAVRVRVAHAPAIGDVPAFSVAYQWRTFTYDGVAFHQSAGSTTFTGPAGLTVTPSHLVFTTVAGPCVTGTLTLRLDNTSGESLVDVSAAIVVPGTSTQGPNCTGTQADVDYKSMLAHLGAVPAGRTTITITIVISNDYQHPPGTTIDDASNYLELRAGDQIMGDPARLVIEYV